MAAVTNREAYTEDRPLRSIPSDLGRTHARAICLSGLFWVMIWNTKCGSRNE
jgi:hypothetical protein